MAIGVFAGIVIDVHGQPDLKSEQYKTDKNCVEKAFKLNISDVLNDVDEEERDWLMKDSCHMLHHLHNLQLNTIRKCFAM